MSETADTSANPDDSTRLRDAVTPIDEIVAAIGRGRIVILVDEMSHGPYVLTVAAEKVTPEQVAFMIRRGGGIISVPLTRSRLKELDIQLMVPRSTDSDRIPYTITVDARDGITTGISASDRWCTIQRLIDEDTKPDDLTRPGHIYPLQYTDGGVLKRAGYTEAAVDLVKEAGCYPAAVLTDVMTDEGDLASLDDLVDFAREHDIAICRIADVIAFRRQGEKLVVKSFEAHMSRHNASYRAIGFRSLIDGNEHLALVLGDIGSGDEVLVRVHSECLAGDVFEDDACGCSSILDEALRRINEAGRGVLIYLRASSDQGGGRLEQLMTHRKGADSVAGDRGDRDYVIGGQILHELGVETMWLLTDDPTERPGVEGHGLSILGFSSLTDQDALSTRAQSGEDEAP